MAGSCPFGFQTSRNQQAFSLGFPKLTVCNVYLMPSPSICHSPSVRPSSVPTLHSKNKLPSRTFIKTKSISLLLLLKTALLQRCDLGLVSALNEIKDYMTCKQKSVLKLRNKEIYGLPLQNFFPVPFLLHNIFQDLDDIQICRYIKKSLEVYLIFIKLLQGML